MQNPQTQRIPYFGYGTNRDHDMMAAMIGRENLLGEPGKLLGYELCVQTLDDIPGVVAENAPAFLSAREIVERVLGPSFELYIIRPSPGSVAYGTIWHITVDELKLVHEWELLDFGMQEKIRAVAINLKGETIHVETHGSLDPSTPVDRVVQGNDYVDYLISKEDILRVANGVRLEYFERNPKLAPSSPTQ